MICTHCNEQNNPMHHYKTEKGEMKICGTCIEKHSRNLNEVMSIESFLSTIGYEVDKNG